MGLKLFENELLYTPNFIGTIYSLDADKIKLKYELDFGKQSLPEEYKTMKLREFKKTFNTKENGDFAYFSGPFFETNNNLIFYLMRA